MAFEARDPQEAELLAVLRRNTGDDATRQVYADWLEQHGYQTRATFLRLEASDGSDEALLRSTAEPADAGWRAAISNPPISRCGVRFGFECTKRWDALARTADDAIRHCDGCDKPVYFCTTVAEAQRHGAVYECIAIDAAVERGEALAGYDRATMRKVGLVMPYAPRPEPPAGAPEKPRLLARVAGWFRR
jgi:uncharacterized protein (TIGR02996 family)